MVAKSPFGGFCRGAAVRPRGGGGLHPDRWRHRADQFAVPALGASRIPIVEALRSTD
jgi:hypothetical protein